MGGAERSPDAHVRLRDGLSLSVQHRKTICLLMSNSAQALVGMLQSCKVFFAIHLFFFSSKTHIKHTVYFITYNIIGGYGWKDWHLPDSGQVPSEQLEQPRDSCAPGISIFWPLDCDSGRICLNSMVILIPAPFKHFISTPFPVLHLFLLKNNQSPIICWLQEIQLKYKDRDRLRVRGWKKVHHANTNY